MFRRRAVLSFLAVAALAAGCKLFKPVNPHAKPETRPAPEPEAAAVTAAPTSTPTSAPAAAPASAQPTSAPSPTVPPPVPAPTRQLERPTPQVSDINDAKIAAMVLASNNTDISYARLVPSRAERADIKEFARRMLTDHTGVNQMVTALLAQLDLTPEDNEASLDFRDESANKRDMMRELSGYTFDSTYIENEVSYHRKFLASIDNVMVPRARNRDLQTLLVNVRPAVAAHLAHAEQVRANVLSRK
jgi:putative membrane protein